MIRLAKWIEWQGGLLSKIKRSRREKGLDETLPYAMSQLTMSASFGPTFLRFAELTGPQADAYLLRTLQYAALHSPFTGNICVTVKNFGPVVLTRTWDVVTSKRGAVVYAALLETGIAVPMSLPNGPSSAPLGAPPGTPPETPSGATSGAGCCCGCCRSCLGEDSPLPPRAEGVPDSASPPEDNGTAVELDPPWTNPERAGLLAVLNKVASLGGGDGLAASSQRKRFQSGAMSAAEGRDILARHAAKYGDLIRQAKRDCRAHERDLRRAEREARKAKTGGAA